MDVLDVLVPVPPDTHPACTAVDEEAIAWNSFLYILSFHIIPLLARIYPWEQVVEGLLKSPYAVQYHSSSGITAAGMSSEPNTVSVTQEKMVKLFSS